MIAGLNAVSNASNLHESLSCQVYDKTTTHPPVPDETSTHPPVPNESTTHPPIPDEITHPPVPKSLVSLESTSSSDGPSFDDSIEYPVVGRDDILRACGAKHTKIDELIRSSPAPQVGKEPVRLKTRSVIPLFCPDPPATTSFDGLVSTECHC